MDLAQEMLQATPEKRLAMWTAHLETLGPDQARALDGFLRKTDPLTDYDPDRVATYADVAKVLNTIRWLWHQWIPRGFITLLGAMAGIGKSFLLLELARIALKNLPWPDQESTLKGSKGRILWLDTEASQAILVKRIEGIGLDPSDFILPTSDPLQDTMLDRPEDLTDIYTPRQYEEGSSEPCTGAEA